MYAGGGGSWAAGVRVGGVGSLRVSRRILRWAWRRASGAIIVDDDDDDDDDDDGDNDIQEDGDGVEWMMMSIGSDIAHSLELIDVEER